MTEKNWYEKELEAELPDDFEPGTDEPVREPSNVGQHTLLSYLVANYDAWALSEPIIKSAYFDDEYKPVVDYLIEHMREYKQVPSIPILRMKTGVLLDRYADAADDRTTEWLIDEIQTFCRHRATEIEIRRASSAIQSDHSRAVLEQIFQNLKQITEISLEKNLGIEVHRDARVVLSTKTEQLMVPTGYKWLDLITGGGLPRPGLLMLPGTPGLGKSNFLTNLLCNYAMRGEFCVYITLELSEQRIFERVCSIMTDTPIRQIYKKKDFVADDLEKRIQTASGGIFYVKKMKMMGTTRSHLHAYLKEITIKEGRQPTVCGLDYIDLMYPVAPVKDLSNIHIKDKYTSQEFYDLLEEWHMVGISPSQRIKNQSELDEYDLGGTAGGAPKNDISDYIIMIKRSDEEMSGYVQKGRYGGEHTKLPFYWNVDTLKITDGPEEKFYHDNPRWDPNFDRKNSEKTAQTQREQINRDSRNVTADHILANLTKSNQQVIEASESEYEIDNPPF